MSATKIAAAFERWHELWTATYPGDIPVADANEQDALEDQIVALRAVCLPDVLAKVTMIREMERGGQVVNENYILASIAADLEQLAPTISPALAALIARWHAIEADHKRDLAEANRRTAGADFKTQDEAALAITGPAADAEAAVAQEIAAFPAQSIADIAAKCAFAAKEGADDFELAQEMVVAVAADAERLAGKGGAA